MNKEQINKSKNAMSCFKQGNFDEAKKAFAELLIEIPDNIQALIYSGYIALLQNRLPEATAQLQNALSRTPQSKAVKSLLADAYYRQDNFSNAANLFKALNRKPHAAKLEYLATKKPYDVFPSVGTTELRFIQKDPMPIIQVSINGADPVNILIDTGGAELIIDTQYAKSLGLAEFGVEKSFFGGGKTGAFTHSYIDSLQLGAFQVKNLPVITMDTRKFSSQLYADAYRVDGILGTCVLYQFLTTLDYVNERIILEQPDAARTASLKDTYRAEGYFASPFWLASDHFMLAKGRANGSSESLYFIDTGLAGMAFTCPKSTIRECGFTLKKSEGFYGSGGGGKWKSLPFDIQSLSLGGINEKNMHGVSGAFPTKIEHIFGFRIGGLISHEFFRNHMVVFDYTNMTMYIK